MPLKVILGVSGSIAAYKSALLVRLLVKKDVEVRVLMTEAAADFITPLTLSTLSKNPVFSSVSDESGWNNHVELGLWADAYIIAPATANTLAQLANGLCQHMLGAVFLSARCPVFIAPAMDVDMWKHPATQANIRKLESFGARIIPVGFGELASGLTGEGRMAEPEEIVRYIDDFFARKQDLAGAKAIVTAGPTYEALDPVRFIGNHSSGKMGIAIADELANRGASVQLILGPSPHRPLHPCVTVTQVVSAQEMYEACDARFAEADIAVLAAAVADYRPAQYATEKIKKKDSEMSIELAKTIDIAATLGKIRRKDQVFAGFALETEQELAHARGKLERKNFDFIVLNSLRDAGAGFGHDTNKIAILRQNGDLLSFDLKAKVAVAADIVDEIVRVRQG